jgi:hypothetical protein
MTFAYSDDAMAKERVAMQRWLGSNVTKPSAQVLDHPAKRKPLGLRPADGPDDDRKRDDDPTNGWQGFRFGKDKDQKFLESAVRFDWLFHFLDTVGAVAITLNNDVVRDINEMQDGLERKFKDIEAAHEAARRTEAADLRATIAELRSEISQMRSIQEAARVASRGERGEQGVRGIPGPQGPAGPRGERGERGAPARETIAWDADAARFVVTPCHSDGTRGVPMNLLGLFQSYDSAVSEIEDRDLVDAAQASRDALDEEIARSPMRG